MKSILFSFITVFSLLCSTAQAEIENVTVTWNAIECTDKCIQLMQQQFAKIPGVQEISIDKNAGHVVLKWKPNAPFSFSPVNIAMELVGVAINEIRVRVHGTLQHYYDTVTLISSGDGTRFDLLNPVTTQLPNQAAQYNTAARKLTPDLRQKLIDAEQQNKIATIEGPLLFPERSPPLELVVSQLSFSNPPSVK